MHFAILTFVIFHLLIDVLFIQTWYYPAYANPGTNLIDVPIIWAFGNTKNSEITFKNLLTYAENANIHESKDVLRNLYSIIDSNRKQILTYLNMRVILREAPIKENKRPIIPTIDKLYGEQSMSYRLKNSNIYVLEEVIGNNFELKNLINLKSLSLSFNRPIGEPFGTPKNISHFFRTDLKNEIKAILEFARETRFTNFVHANKGKNFKPFEDLGVILKLTDDAFAISTLPLTSAAFEALINTEIEKRDIAEVTSLLQMQLLFKLFDEEEIVYFNHYLFERLKLYSTMFRGKTPKWKKEVDLIEIERGTVEILNNMQSTLTFRIGKGILGKVEEKQTTKETLKNTLQAGAGKKTSNSKPDRFQDILPKMQMRASFKKEKTRDLYSNFLKGSNEDSLSLIYKFDVFLNELINEWPELVKNLLSFTMSQQYITFEASILHLVMDLLDNQELTLGARYGDEKLGVYFVVEDTFKVRLYFKPATDIANVDTTVSKKSSVFFRTKTTHKSHLEFLSVFSLWSSHLHSHYLDRLDSVFLGRQFVKKLFYLEDYTKLLEKISAFSAV